MKVRLLRLIIGAVLSNFCLNIGLAEESVASEFNSVASIKMEGVELSRLFISGKYTLSVKNERQVICSFEFSEISKLSDSGFINALRPKGEILSGSGSFGWSHEITLPKFKLIDRTVIKANGKKFLLVKYYLSCKHKWSLEKSKGLVIGKNVKIKVVNSLIKKPLFSTPAKCVTGDVYDLLVIGSLTKPLKMKIPIE